MYVEYLTLSVFFRTVVPAQPAECFIFDADSLALWLARSWAKRKGLRLEKLDFHIEDVRDEEGKAAFLQVLYHDSAQLQERILHSQDFEANAAALPPGLYARACLEKSPVYSYDIYGPGKYEQLWHVLLLVRIAAWHARTNPSDTPLQLHINKRPWFDELKAYAKEKGIDLIASGKLRTASLRQTLARKLAKLSPGLVKSLCAHQIFGLGKKLGLAKSRQYFSTDSPRLLAEYWGNLGLQDAHTQSDLFFLNPDGIQPQDVVLTFNLAADPIDEQKYALLKSRQIATVALTPQSCRLSPGLVPVFGQIKDLSYEGLRRYWRRFFQTYNIKLYTGWNKYETNHMALAEAMADVGGISTCYQRAYEPNPSPQVTVGSDIIFGFSPEGYDIEKANRSCFRYHVAVGYIGDYRFAALKPYALKLRKKLLAAGAKKIIAYFDENTVSDGRWFMGHELAQKNYYFWLQKVLEDPQLGIVFKPKRPATLPQRLNGVTELLEEAQKTGRCIVVKGGAVQGSWPPAYAALAADVAIHDCLSAGTAGLESALAGVPTLLVDLEGWPLSPLYKLGADVVFQDWPQVWQACQDYFKNPAGRPGLGNWKHYLDHLDPFHDGKAGLRMSQFLKWMLESLRAGKNRQAAMAEAVERYAGLWGADKISRYDSVARKTETVH